jgi:hypothetical protein
MVRTGASSYIRYGWESTFGASPGDSALDKAFGLNARLTNWSLTHNPKDLPTLGQVEVKDYAYGQQVGSMGVDFVLSNPWIFGAVYGEPAKTGSSPYVYKYGTTAGVHAGAKAVRTFTTEVGFEGETNTQVRRGLGCIANSLGISTTIDGTVDCTLDIGYGKEDSTSGSVYTSGFDTTPPADTEAFPYTFAHGQLKWAGEGGADTGASGSIVAELQDASISFAQNPTLLYTIGSHQSVASFRRVFDITGNFRASWKNDDKLNQLLDQIRKPLTKPTTSLSSAPEIILTFTNSGTGAAQKSIEMKLHGVRPDSHGVEGIQPVEPVFENIAWRTKTCEIVCANQTNKSTPF